MDDLTCAQPCGSRAGGSTAQGEHCPVGALPGGPLAVSTTELTEKSEVPLASPKSLQCGQKSPFDGRSEAWLRLGLCPQGGPSIPPPLTRVQLCHLAVPAAAMVGDWGLEPQGNGGACHQHGSQLEASSSVVSLCGGWQVSDPRALDSRTPFSSLAHEVSLGVRNNHCHSSTHLR